MSSRKEIVSGFYDQADEDVRLQKTRHGQLEYYTTMAYIHRYADRGSKVLEVGAGTGRYSVALAKEGMDVTAVELTESNLKVLREKSAGIERISACQGDATDLGRFQDGLFDVTLLLGPMYHLYEADEINRAIDEAIRVTKPGGVLFFAFLSVFAIMYANYFYGNWAAGQAENFTDDYKVKHFKEQLFTGYDVTEFEGLFQDKPVDWITTTGVDGLLEPIEFPCRMRIFRPLRNGIWLFPKSGSSLAAQTTSCIFAESVGKHREIGKERRTSKSLRGAASLGSPCTDMLSFSINGMPPIPAVRAAAHGGPFPISRGKRGQSAFYRGADADGGRAAKRGRPYDVDRVLYVDGRA